LWRATCGGHSDTEAATAVKLVERAAEALRYAEQAESKET
jgi:hypothetical protein